MKLILYFTLMFLCSCLSNPITDETHAMNIDMKIVSINGETILSSGKHHKPQLCNTILLVTLTEPELYREINTCKYHPYIYIDTEWLYNHCPGDTVHFDYLLKSEFFTIKDRNGAK